MSIFSRKTEVQVPLQDHTVYLIDTENVRTVWTLLLDRMTVNDKIYVFYTMNSGNVSYEDLNGVLSSGKSIELIQCHTGKNGLDFQLVSYLGYLIRNNENADYCIISDDSGYDAVIKFWEGRDVDVTRKTAFQVSGKQAKPQKKSIFGVKSKPKPQQPKVQNTKTADDKQSKPQTSKTADDNSSKSQAYKAAEDKISKPQASKAVNDKNSISHASKTAEDKLYKPQSSKTTDDKQNSSLNVKTKPEKVLQIKEQTSVKTESVISSKGAEKTEKPVQSDNHALSEMSVQTEQPVHPKNSVQSDKPAQSADQAHSVKPVKTGAVQKKQLTGSMEDRLRSLFPDENEERIGQISEIIRKSGGKKGLADIHDEIEKLYRNERASEIYRAIRHNFNDIYC